MNAIRVALAEGRPSFGGWSTMADSVSAELLLVRVPGYEIDIDHAERSPSSFQWVRRTVPMVVG